MRSGSKDDYGIFCLFPSSDMEIYSAKREHHEPFTRLNNSANFINYHWVFTKISRSSLMSRFMCRFVLENAYIWKSRNKLILAGTGEDLNVEIVENHRLTVLCQCSIATCFPHFSGNTSPPFFREHLHVSINFHG